ncbi:hypothetical protein D9619_002107 [Psilocybe cf. subviscida]|uniref:Peptidase S8/S53 domain-containing protein n=1 Tax=Psilocybe cf. subviscida TaxID=2480587 RepID=A0A8H5BEW1_9AGAR|nr:hypothetical protein D9619_002107 [Psilocybe cf. subviscida]
MTRLTQWALAALSLTGVALSTPLSTSSNAGSSSSSGPLTLAPLVDTDHIHGSINNSYIVMLKNDLPAALFATHMNFLENAHGANPLMGEDFSGVQQVYDGHITGYAGRFAPGVVEQIRRMPEVAYVEKDQIVKIQEIATQKSAPWGLGRISHRNKLSLSTFNKYLHEPQGGEGVDVYVIDTGIYIGHVEFEGRARWGKTIPQDVDEDGNGHGTHCAGTIASRKYGVAKAASVIAVKVLGSDGSGSMSDVVAGVVWAAAEAKKNAAAAAKELATTGRTAHKGSVANMSLGGGRSRALDDAVNGAVDSGLHFAVAAGNDNSDACDYSPAAAEGAVTVGASTLSDERAYFSNHGECVDVFAPGLNILSTWTGSDTAINTISGTSMASPHTAGLLAYFLSIYPSKNFNPTFTDAGELLSIAPQHVLSPPVAGTTRSLYAMAHRVTPAFIRQYLPSPEFLEVVLGEENDVAPVSTSTITPDQLKKALLALSTVDALVDLPANTVNKLIFNNATS